MITFFLIVAIGILSLKITSLKKRIEICEKKLRGETTSFSPPLQQTVQEEQEELPVILSPPSPPILEEIVEEVKEEYAPLYLSTKEFQLPRIGLIKENWMGVFGSAALVIGSVFFALTSKIMQLPQSRVGTIVAASFLMLGISHKIKTMENGLLVSGWLRAIGGSIFLFATVAAGGISGLKFIDNPFYALIFLCCGVGINLLLAFTTPFQMVASFHVILSLISFCMVPQAPLLLPLGALVACIGLLSAYRSKWDFHLLLIVIAFSVLNYVWSTSQILLPAMHDLAIGCSVGVALLAAGIHYSKKYEAPHFEILPLMAHIFNWALLFLNITFHSHFFKGSPLILAILAVGGFFLANYAKKGGIRWLYYTDTLLSQFLMIGALICLSILEVHPIDICILLILEILIFNAIFEKLKELFLLRVGLGVLYFVCLLTAFFILTIIANSIFHNLRINIELRLGILAFLCWLYYFRSEMTDSADFILHGEEKGAHSFSFTALFGTGFFLLFLIFGSHPLICLSLVAGVGLWKRRQKDLSLNIFFFASVICLHLLTWGRVSLYWNDYLSQIIGMAILDLLIIFGNKELLSPWQRRTFIYAFAFHVGFCTYFMANDVSHFVPSLLFLFYSLAALEGGRILSKKGDENLSVSLTKVGIAFLATFLIRFFTLHLGNDANWHGFLIRWMVEVAGLATLLNWIGFYPKTEDKLLSSLEPFLVEGALAFTSFCLFIEVPDPYKPMMWIFAALSLLSAPLIGNFTSRLMSYSWIYFIASLSYALFKTGSFMVTFSTIVLQVFFFWIVYRSQQKICRILEQHPKSTLNLLALKIYREWNLTLLLPFFSGIALLFALNFEKALLTLLWVGLSSLYLGTALFIKSKRAIQIAMGAFVLCCIRLILFDLTHTDLALRALSFIGVGILMLGMSILYKQFKHRIEAPEGI